MLLNLKINNFALIKESDIMFTKGLNILSGETGAGKSIIFEALSVALGESCLLYTSDAADDSTEV